MKRPQRMSATLAQVQDIESVLMAIRRMVASVPRGEPMPNEFRGNVEQLVDRGRALVSTIATNVRALAAPEETDA